MAERPRDRSLTVEAAALLVLLAVNFALRWPALSTEGFHNEDAAGIAYNADLLRHGLLPLRDSVETKAPGAFFAAWGVWGVFGRSLSALVWAGAWLAWLSAVALHGTARTLWGPRAGLVAATLYTVVSPVSDSIDLNYQTWMALPWVASGWAFVAALARGRVALYVLAGALVVLAAQVKHQCAALGPMYALLVIASRYVALPDGFTPGPVGRGLAGLVGGAVLGFVPLGLWYAAHGALGDFLGTFFLSEGGWKYARSPLDLGEKLLRLGDGLLGFWEYLALPTVLAAGALLGLRRGLRRPTLVGLLLLGLFGAGFLAAAVGFRFYKSYYLHLLPALALAAAAPGNLAALLLERTTYRWSPPGRRLQGLLVASGVGVLLVFAAAQDAGNLRQIRQERRFARDLDAQRVAKVVAAHSAPEDRIWVWGRWAWPVYFHADRRAASRNYKVMNVLTTPLTNTWRRPGTPETFVADGPWREILDEVQAARPAFVVVAPNEDRRGFKAFNEWLARDFRSVPVAGSKTLTLYARKDVQVPTAPAKPAKPKPAKPAKSAKPNAPKSSAPTP